MGIMGSMGSELHFPPQYGVDINASSSLSRPLRIPIPRDNSSHSPKRTHRQHVGRACEACRQRKTKCTGEKEGCRNCRNGPTPCRYTDGKREKSKKQMAELLKRVEELENAIYGLSTELGQSFEIVVARGTKAYVQTNNGEPLDGHQQADFDRSFPGQHGSRLQELQGTEVKLEKLQAQGTTFILNDMSSTASSSQSPVGDLPVNQMHRSPMVSGLTDTANTLSMITSAQFNQTSASTMLAPEPYYPSAAATQWGQGYHSTHVLDDVVDYGEL
ncbi:hypothetical protein BDW74DRAFT_143964 [Aspergillus multicolor]|uniref:Zn(II)2Cys6 transcription factor domain-containing protein n=1 Tax=Aspergillus multicolor TaxID=41759 RepID=UPI003CCD60C4